MKCYYNTNFLWEDISVCGPLHVGSYATNEEFVATNVNAGSSGLNLLAGFP